MMQNWEELCLDCENNGLKKTRSEKIIEVLESRLYFTAIMIAISTIVLCYTIVYNAWGDLNNYYNNAGDVLSGLMPYSEAKFEYPPLCLVFMLIPRILTWSKESFYYGCAILTYVFLIIGIYFLNKIADRYIGTRWQTHLILICLIGFSTYFVIARNDVYPTVMAIVSLWLYMNKRYELSFIVMALASMTKIYPIIFFIPMIAPFILRREWKQTIKLFCIAAFTCVILELPFLLTDPSTAFAYLTYHSDRGIQIESVASGFFMMYDLLVPGDLNVVSNYGSDNLSGIGPDSIAPYMTYLTAFAMLAFMIAIMCRICKRVMPSDRIYPLVCLLATTLLLIFITFNKVYSAQYMIWIIMLLPFTQMNCFNKKDQQTILILLIPFGLFSMLSYCAYNVFEIHLLNTIPIIMVFIKNIFHVILMIALINMCWKETNAILKSMPVER